MSLNSAFVTCVDSLYRVCESFSKCKPSKIEHFGPAETVAFMFFDIACRHARAFCTLAENPEPDIHILSAATVARSTFETAMLARWLIMKDEPQERIVRYLRVLKKEANEKCKLAKNLRAYDSDRANEYDKKVDRLNEHCAHVESRTRSPAGSAQLPNVIDIVKEVTGTDQYYVLYRWCCEFSHARQANVDKIWQETEDLLSSKSPDFGNWADLIRMVSWSLAKAGPHVLVNVGVVPSIANGIAAAHKDLLAEVDKLDSQTSP